MAPNENKINTRRYIQAVTPCVTSIRSPPPINQNPDTFLMSLVLLLKRVTGCLFSVFKFFFIYYQYKSIVYAYKRWMHFDDSHYHNDSTTGRPIRPWYTQTQVRSKLTYVWKLMALVALFLYVCTSSGKYIQPYSVCMEKCRMDFPVLKNIANTPFCEQCQGECYYRLFPPFIIYYVNPFVAILAIGTIVFFFWGDRNIPFFKDDKFLLALGDYKIRLREWYEINRPQKEKQSLSKVTVIPKRPRAKEPGAHFVSGLLTFSFYFLATTNFLFIMIENVHGNDHSFISLVGRLTVCFIAIVLTCISSIFFVFEDRVLTHKYQSKLDIYELELECFLEENNLARTEIHTPTTRPNIKGLVVTVFAGVREDGKPYIFGVSYRTEYHLNE